MTIDNWIGGKRNETTGQAKVGKTNPEQKASFGSLQKDNLVLVGCDIEALYPSMDPTRTGEAVRQEVERGDIKWAGVDWFEALKYV